MSKNSIQDPQDQKKNKLPAKKIKITILACISLLILGTVLAYPFYVHAINHESTDDAFIEAHVVSISPRVPGHVSKVFIADNQRVEKGQMLAEIDRRNYQVALEIAEARMASANATVKEAEALVVAARKELAQKQAELSSQTAGLSRVKAQVSEAEAGHFRDANDLSRIRRIAEAGAVSIQEFDHAKAQEKMSQANLRSAKSNIHTQNAKILEARAGIEAAASKLHQAFAQTEMRKAKLREAEAQVRQARLDLSYTRIKAPCSGYVTKKTVESGNYVMAGQKLLNIVSPEVWIVANFKETQIHAMREGQHVDIDIDSFPGIEFSGKVDSIQRGTGSRFTLLPPENAAGNFIKVVQRVPVKIVFDNSEQNYRISPGMSVIPSVDISSGDDLPQQMASAEGRE
ncbi:HlyD family secretion protein [Maridesulfovibrio sp.]|uniref:HlyD family secretion protein n=1 Tax=Maridesulfovibrio sp. TaxID=2795000 RepID=UPI002AA6F065|nr:HlyD family secretion protein [Maridesulfovibrio sp.]